MLVRSRLELNFVVCCKFIILKKKNFSITIEVSLAKGGRLVIDIMSL